MFIECPNKTSFSGFCSNFETIFLNEEFNKLLMREVFRKYDITFDELSKNVKSKEDLFLKIINLMTALRIDITEDIISNYIECEQKLKIYSEIYYDFNKKYPLINSLQSTLFYKGLNLSGLSEDNFKEYIELNW